MRDKGLLLVLVPLVFELVFIAILVSILLEAEHDLKAIEHARDSIAGIQKVHEAVLLEILSIGQNPETSLSEKRQQEIQFFRMLKESPQAIDTQQYPELKEVIAMGQEIREQASLVWGRYPKFNSTDALLFFMNLQKVSEKMLAIEGRVARDGPKRLAEINTQLIIFLVGGASVCCAVSLGLSQFIMSDIVLRIRKIAENAHQLAAGGALQQHDSGSDEIGRLDEALLAASLALQESRRRELAVLDNAADVIITIDRKLRIVSINATVTKDWHFKPDDVIGMQLISLLDRATVDDTRTRFEELSCGNTDVEVHFENRIRTAEGTFKSCHWTLRWSKEDRLYYGIVRDITEMKAVNERKREFLSIVRNDLNEPLSSLSNLFDSILTTEAGGNQAAAALALRSQQSIVRLSDLVNELMELDSIERGKETVFATKTSVYEACRQAAESLETLAQKSGLKLHCPVSDEFVLAESKRLIQVMTNLLSNAIKFSPSGSEISILVEAEKDWVSIGVRDQGPGIATEDRKLIFERFRQSQEASRIAVKGTGLGLAIVKTIIEGYGGKVTIDSELGRGSTFWIMLCRAQAEAQT